MLVRFRSLCLVVCLLASVAASAQQVVVFDFAGDPRGRVREQLLGALGAAGKVQLVSLKQYKDAAAGLGFRDARAESPQAIAAVAPELRIHAFVGGEVRGRFSLRIYDARGQVIWSKELPLSGGRLSDENARRLAAAIAVAATPPEEPAPPVEPPQPNPPAPPPEQPDAGTPVPVPPPALPPPGPDAGTPPPEVPAAPVARPPLVEGYASGSTTWRGYCARPGVNACRQWDELPPGTQPAGETVDFSSPFPYSGYSAGLDVFPLASSAAWWRGFGVRGGFAQAFSLTSVKITSPSGTTSPRTIVSQDVEWFGLLAFRQYFFLGPERLIGYVGGLGGMRGHDFSPGSGTLFGGSHRRFPEVGLEGALPLAKLVRVEVAASYFIAPVPGKDELSKYGQPVRSQGFGATLGLGGDVWGPLGYAVRFRFEGYGDVFSGTGTRWANGGASQEYYAVVYWGLTAKL